MNRLNKVNFQFAPAAAASGGKKDSLSVVDNRTGKYTDLQYLSNDFKSILICEQ